MNRPRMLRLLRIGWSAGWAIACVLLIGLWMRSYSAIQTADSTLPSLKRILTQSQLRLAESRNSHSGVSTAEIAVLEERVIKGQQVLEEYQAQLRGKQKPQLMRVAIYHSISLLCAALAAAPWLCWRFSLRTLLIATTLVAVVLGVIVWVR